MPAGARQGVEKLRSRTVHQGHVDRPARRPGVHVVTNNFCEDEFWLCVCPLHVYAHIHTHTYIRTHTCAHIHAHIYMRTHTYGRDSKHTATLLYIHSHQPYTHSPGNENALRCKNSQLCIHAFIRTFVHAYMTTSHVAINLC